MTGFTGTNCAGKKMKFKACYFFFLFFEPTLISLPNKLFSLKDRTCPDDCSGQGTCDASTGTCTCNTGFTGANCAGKKKIPEHDFYEIFLKPELARSYLNW